MVKEFNVKINSQDIAIVEHEIKKGTAKGETYFKPKEEGLTLDILVKAYGEKAIMESFILPKLNTYSNMLTKEARDEATTQAGDDEAKFEQVFIESFTKMLTELSARGETVKALTEKLNNYVLQFAMETDDTKSAELGKLIKATKIALEAKKHKDDDDEDKKPASNSGSGSGNVGGNSGNEAPNKQPVAA